MLYVFISLRNIHIQHVQTRTIREAEHNRQEEEPQMTRKWSMETMVSNFKMPPSRTWKSRLKFWVMMKLTSRMKITTFCPTREQISPWCLVSVGLSLSPPTLGHKYSKYFYLRGKHPRTSLGLFPQLTSPHSDVASIVISSAAVSGYTGWHSTGGHWSAASTGQCPRGHPGGNFVVVRLFLADRCGN